MDSQFKKAILPLLVLGTLLVGGYYGYKLYIVREIAFRTDPETTQKLYQALKDTDELMTQSNIKHWIDGGTLLGAIRHKGLIPWDDDADLTIDENDEEKFISLEPKFNKLGYRVIRSDGFFKVFPENGKPIKGKNWNYPYIDIFITRTNKGSIFFKTLEGRKVWGKREGKPVFLLENELNPLKDYKFGPLTLKGPANPELYIEALYGKTWYTVAVREYDHEREEEVSKQTLRMAKLDYEPLLPKDPLKDRVKKG